MKKRIFSALLLLLMCLCFAMSAGAAEVIPADDRLQQPVSVEGNREMTFPEVVDTPQDIAPAADQSASGNSMPVGSSALASRLLDETYLYLTPEQTESLRQRFDAVSTARECDVVAFIVSSIGGYLDISSYADAVCAQYDYGYNDGYTAEKNCVLLIVDVGGGEYWIKKTGSARTLVDEDRIASDIIDFLAEDDFYDAFDTYINDCDVMLSGAYRPDSDGLSQDTDDGSEGGNAALKTLASVACGAGGSFAFMGAKKGQMTTVRSQRAAGRYMRGDSIRVNDKNDVFLYKKVDRMRINRAAQEGQNGSGMRPGGTGGGGGSFRR